MAPFYGWSSTASGLRSHYEEMVYLTVNWHNYILVKVSEIEAYFSKWIYWERKIAEKMKCLATISKASEIGLITTFVVTGFFSIFKFSSGWALLKWVALSDVICVSLATAASWRSTPLFAVKKKNNLIKLVAQIKLDSIAYTISKPIESEDISPTT